MEVWRKCKGETEMGRMLICHDKKAENPLYMKEFELQMGELTDDEREIILKGCLINFNRVS